MWKNDNSELSMAAMYRNDAGHDMFDGIGSDIQGHWKFTEDNIEM